MLSHFHLVLERNGQAALSVAEEGTELLKCYTMTQLITRLTYERRKLM